MPGRKTANTLAIGLAIGVGATVSSFWRSDESSGVRVASGLVATVVIAAVAMGLLWLLRRGRG